MGVGAAVVSADWVALASLWEAPTNPFNLFTLTRIFSRNICLHLPLLHECYMPFPSHPLRLSHTNNIAGIKILNVKLSQWL
jgi:hypothetical protein